MTCVYFFLYGIQKLRMRDLRFADVFVYDGNVAYSFFVTSANGGNKNETLAERRKQTNKQNECV